MSEPLPKRKRLAQELDDEISDKEFEASSALKCFVAVFEYYGELWMTWIQGFLH